MKKEEEERLIQKKIQEEQDSVRKEVLEYTKAIEQLKALVKHSKETLRNWFTMHADSREEYMDINEYRKLLR